MPISPRRYLKVSRPKFWLYLLGPYFLGAVLAADAASQLRHWPFLVLFAWFTLPANLLLYGVNDIADFDTDQHNPKKAEDEALVQPQERPALALTILALSLLALPSLLAGNGRVTTAFIAFILLSLAYSLPPLRLKARPGLDSLSNVLYLTPLLIGWFYFSRDLPPIPLVIAGVAWCAAMHAYSAIPDIDADRAAGLSTIATVLGRDCTLGLCLLCYATTALLVTFYDSLAGLVLAVYPAVILAQLVRARTRVREWYRYFPVLNGCLGMCLTLRFLWPLTR